MTIDEFTNRNDVRIDDVTIKTFNDKELDIIFRSLTSQDETAHRKLEDALLEALPESVSAVYPRVRCVGTRIYIYKPDTESASSIEADLTGIRNTVDFLHLFMPGDNDAPKMYVEFDMDDILAMPVFHDRRTENADAVGVYFRAVGDIMSSKPFADVLQSACSAFRAEMTVIEGKSAVINRYRRLYDEFNQTKFTDGVYADGIGAAMRLFRTEFAETPLFIEKDIYSDTDEAFCVKYGNTVTNLSLNTELMLDRANSRDWFSKQKVLSDVCISADFIKRRMRYEQMFDERRDAVKVYGRDITLTGKYQDMMDNPLRVERMNALVAKAVSRI